LGGLQGEELEQAPVVVKGNAPFLETLSSDRERCPQEWCPILDKHVLIRHKAKLHIESTVGKGSTFRCDFPHEAITSPQSQVKLDQLA
jgi:hypothetical protein